VPLLVASRASLTSRSDASAPQQPAYPPPANAIAGQNRGPNPYAQQNVSAAPGPGHFNQYGGQSPPNVSYAVTPDNGNQYAAQQEGNQYAAQQGGNQYAAQPGYGANAGNPYAQQQYGQQDQYAGGAPGANGASVVGGNDFWAELSSTNSALSQLQEEIQAVRTAHQQSLVSNSGCISFLC